MKTGVIIANTGSPSSPDPDDIEAYLRDFLMDDRIRQLPKPLWKHLMFKRVLPKRKFTSAEHYRFIWTPEGSPLIAYQQRLANKVQDAFNAEGRGESSDDAVVACSAMSYGDYTIDRALTDLRAQGCNRVVLLPLYPQSAYSPTQAVIDAYKRAIKSIGWNPPSCIIDNYHDNPLYLNAIADRIRTAGYRPAAGDHLLFSFHAIPLKDERAGDTYRSQVARSTQLIAERLGIATTDITVAYQSVFGGNKSAWVSPLATDVLTTWRNEDSRVFFCCPGFSIDCLETLYDVPHDMVPALEGETALPVTSCAETGGDIQAACHTSGRFVWVPCLNDSNEHCALVHGVVSGALDEGRFEGGTAL